MGKKAKLNYIVDVIILLMFVMSTLSGFGLMRPKEERTVGTQTVVDAYRSAIIDAHVISSFLLLAGVIVHFVLHWRWMVTMSRNMMQNREEARMKGGAL